MKFILCWLLAHSSLELSRDLVKTDKGPIYAISVQVKFATIF